MQPLPRTLGILAVILASILWGTTGTSATFAPSLSPLLIGAVAMGIGGILQCLLALKQIVNQHQLLIKYYKFLIIGAVAVAIYPLAFYTSMRWSGVTIGTVVSIGSAPILAVIIEYLNHDFKLTTQWLIGAILGILGMVLLSFADNNTVNLAYEHLTMGIFLGIIAGLTYALYSWSARKLMLKGIATKSAMGAIFGCGGLLLMPIIMFMGAPLFESVTNLAVGIYMAFIPMFFGYLCYGFGLANIPASTATTITLLEPVIATILAIFIVGESLSLIGWLGISLILICLIFITIPLKKY